MYITESTLAEPKAASTLLDRRRFARRALSTLGADKGYHSKGSMALPRRCDIRPHIARIESRCMPGLDERTTRHGSYRVGQRKRKRIEEIFGWLKTVGGLRKSRFIGIARTQLAAYNISNGQYRRPCHVGRR
ncbi:MAG: hypothetical protein ACREU2_16915 [Steroidobacteraceae bacterium]